MSDSARPRPEKPLLRWMRFVLRFAAIFNVCAGANMVLLPQWTYATIGMEPQSVDFPIQLVGLLVALFGCGYYQVARRPLENRTLLWLGFWSKALGSVLGTYYVVRGILPWRFVPVYFLADVIYLPFFWVILRRLERFASSSRED